MGEQDAAGHSFERAFASRGPFRIFSQSIERMQHANTEIVIGKTFGSTRRIGSPGLGPRWQQAAVRRG